MRVLTIRQPWAGAVFHGKDIENRPGLFTYRGPLFIHAGQYLGDPAAFETVEDLTGVRVPVFGSPRAGVEWELGAVIGVVDLVNAHRSADCKSNCSRWAQAFQAHHVLANPRVLRRPVPARGKQGLWTADEALEAAVREQLA